MSENSFGFGLDRVDHALVEALRQALENVMPDIMSDNNFLERNGFGQFRWNAIIAQLRDICNHLGWLDFGTCKRGGWKTPVLFYPVDRYIFTFMTEATLRSVQHRKDKGTHYLCGGASYNVDVHPASKQLEMDLLPPVRGAEHWIAKSREQLAAAVNLDVGEINGHILVVFDENNDKLISVRAVRLTKDLEISTEEEDWTRYIRMPYITDQAIEPQLDSDDEDEMLVELLNE